MTTIYLTRHGQTYANQKNILQGQSESDLTPKGANQLKVLYQHLKNINFAHCYVSKLKRTHQSASILFDNRNIEITQNELLNERCFGIFENKPKKELAEYTAKKLQNYKKNPLEEKKFTIHESIESNHEIYLRFKNFIDTVNAKHQNETILAITHGGVIRSLLEHLGVLTIENYNKVKITNSCTFILKTNKNEIKIKNSFNL